MSASQQAHLKPTTIPLKRTRGKPVTQAIRARVAWAANIVAVVLVVGIAWYLNGIQSEYIAKQTEAVFWKELCQNTHTGLIVVDPANLTITEWNDGATEILGWPATDVVGGQYFFLLSEPYATKHATFAFDLTLPNRMLGRKLHVKCWVNTQSGVRAHVNLQIAAVRIDSKVYYVVMFDPVEHVYWIPDIPKPSTDAPKIAVPRHVQQRYVPEFNR